MQCNLAFVFVSPSVAAHHAWLFLVTYRALIEPGFLCVQGEAGTGNVVEAVRHCRAVMGAIKQLQTLDDDELYVYAKEIRAPIELVRQVKTLGR